MFFVILLNNSAKSFSVLLSGILFELVPLVAVATNGYVLAVAYLFASEKVGYVQAAKAVLPHDVLEIPAVIFTADYGLFGSSPIGLESKNTSRTDSRGAGQQDGRGTEVSRDGTSRKSRRTTASRPSAIPATPALSRKRTRSGPTWLPPGPLPGGR